MAAPLTRWLGSTPAQLRQEIQQGNGRHLQLRRAQVLTNLFGISMMALTTLLQMGIVSRLPEPKVGNFKTKKVNSSDEAYSYGGPDSPVNIVAHSVNLMIASTGGQDRAKRHPWLPLLAAGLAAAQASVAAKYLFYQMPKVDQAWCPYCIADAVAHFVNFGLTLPEASDAARSLDPRDR